MKENLWDQGTFHTVTQLHFGQWTSLLFCLPSLIACPVARQNVSLLATAHDWETGLLANGRSGVSSGHFELSHLSINEVELGTEYHGLAAPIMSGPTGQHSSCMCTIG